MVSEHDNLWSGLLKFLYGPLSLTSTHCKGFLKPKQFSVWWNDLSVVVPVVQRLQIGLGMVLGEGQGMVSTSASGITCGALLDLSRTCFRPSILLWSCPWVLWRGLALCRVLCGCGVWRQRPLCDNVALAAELDATLSLLAFSPLHDVVDRWNWSIDR